MNLSLSNVLNLSLSNHGDTSSRLCHSMAWKATVKAYFYICVVWCCIKTLHFVTCDKGFHGTTSTCVGDCRSSSMLATPSILYLQFASPSYMCSFCEVYLGPHKGALLSDCLEKCVDANSSSPVASSSSNETFYHYCHCIGHLIGDYSCLITRVVGSVSW